MPTVLLLAAVALAADDPKPAPADPVAALKKEYADAQAAYRKADEPLGESADDQKKSAELWKAFDAKQGELFQKAVDLAKADPKSDAAFAALEWVLTVPRAYYLPAGGPAMTLMRDHHAANPKVGKAAVTVGYYIPHEMANPAEHKAAVALLDAVLTANPDKTARGQAAFALAHVAKGRADTAAAFEDNRLAAGNPPNDRSAAEVDRLAAEAERRYEALAADYGDCKRLLRENDPRTLGDEAKAELHELRNLRQGKPAPAVAGDDLSGKPFALADHKGKVVLLVFWASWCGPCMADVPHEKELVDKFKGRPFVLVGVNGDDKREDARKAVEKAGIPWRSVWNGDQGPAGPISRAWNVRGWPTVYVIDHAGVIRHKHLRGKNLDKPLERLVAEAEAAGSR